MQKCENVRMKFANETNACKQDTIHFNRKIKLKYSVCLSMAAMYVYTCTWIPTDVELIEHT